MLGNMADAFPVLWHYKTPQVERVPATVPLAWVEGFAKRLNRNHGQTVKRLAERGGLDPSELWCGHHDKGLWDDGVPDTAGAVAWLRAAPWIGHSADRKE